MKNQHNVWECLGMFLMVLGWGWDPLKGSISSCGDINATLLCASKWIASQKPLSPTTQQPQRSLVPCSLTVEITKNSENQEPNFPGPTMALPTLPDTTYWAGRATLCDHGCMDARCKLVNGIIKSRMIKPTRTGSVQKWWTLKLDATVEHFLKLFQLGISWVRAAHLPGVMTAKVMSRPCSSSQPWKRPENSTGTR